MVSKSNETKLELNGIIVKVVSQKFKSWLFSVSK